MLTSIKTGTGDFPLELEFEPLELRTAHPFGISYGTSSLTRNLLIRIRCGELVGYGEAAPTEYHGQSPETALAILADWKNGILLSGPETDQDLFSISLIAQRMSRAIAGNGAVKAGVEMALWDLAGKSCGLSLRKMLGITGLNAPLTDFTIGIDSLDMVAKKTEEALAAGYKILKVKQGTPYDRQIIEKVRSVAPNMPLRVDANGGWDCKTTIEMAAFLAENNVQFIEQPLPKDSDKEDFRFVRERSVLPIYADESVSLSSDVAKLAGCVDGIVVKLAKTGGILEALKVIHTARAHGMKIMFGCMIESSIGVTAAVHLAPLVDHLDLDGALLLAEDPFIGARYDDGYLLLDDAPGLGVAPRNQGALS